MMRKWILAGFGGFRSRMHDFPLIRNGCASGTPAFTRAQKEKRVATKPMGNAGFGA